MGGRCPPVAAEFRHRALPDSSNHIRLVQVLDDNYSENIKVRCWMTTWAVDEIPSYHAISYTWGNPESNATILINDKKFWVRTNCEFVLKQAYWYDKCCYYWIDAICIDQQNLEEKSKQVGTMGNIYKTADHVLACVGAHADQSILLYREVALRDAISKIFLNESKYSSKTLLKLCQRHGISTICRFLHAARQFAKRPYFSRLWVVQELRNARQAYFLCGPDILPKEVIYVMFLELDCVFFGQGLRSQSMLISFLWSLRAAVHPRTNLEYRRSTHKEMSNVYFFTDDSVDAGSLLLDVRPLQCAQRRDKLYGILSILDWDDIVPPLPNYKNSDFEVALEFIQPISDFMNREIQRWDPADTCGDIKNLLGLNERSEGVFDAIEARRGVPDPVLVGLRPPVDAPPTQMRSVAKGWRISGELFIKQSPQSSVWKLPGSTMSRAVLPKWVREGDWMLEPRTFTQNSLYSWLLVLREVDDGYVSPIIGQGFLTSGYSTVPADSVFQVYWNTEDLLLCVIMGDCGERSITHGVCEKQTPGSSYAIRQHSG